MSQYHCPFSPVGTSAAYSTFHWYRSVSFTRSPRNWSARRIALRADKGGFSSSSLQSGAALSSSCLLQGLLLWRIQERRQEKLQILLREGWQADWMPGTPKSHRRNYPWRQIELGPLVLQHETEQFVDFRLAGRLAGHLKPS